MRKILFRGKRIDNGKWVEGQTIVVIHQDDNDLIFMPQRGEDSKADIMDGNDRTLTSIYGNYYQILPQTVGQYTGLTDKNGNKIFEGDIIFDPELKENHIVMFDEGGFCTEEVFLQSYLCFGEMEVEVIGNIHDNPELLEADK